MAYISAFESSAESSKRFDDSGKHSPASPMFHGVAPEPRAVDAWMDVASKGEAQQLRSRRLPRKATERIRCRRLWASGLSLGTE
jgi:hypothetical protein